MKRPFRITRRDFTGGCLVFVAGKVLARPGWLEAQDGPSSAGPPSPQLIEDLVAANRILAAEGVVDGYGHVSARHDRDPHRYLLSRSLAPELVTVADILEFDLDSKPVEGKGSAVYQERFIHGEIYKARSDVMAVVHNHSPALIPFGMTNTALRPAYHMSAFVAQGIPTFEIRSAGGNSTDMLVKTAELGRALAQTLGNHPAALMRGHGAVVVGSSLPYAVARSVYLQMNARLQAEAVALGHDVTYLNGDEARNAEATQGDYGRAWDLWKRKAMAK